MSSTKLDDFVIVSDECPVTDSRVVARHYARRHADVLRSISAMLTSRNSEIASFAQRNFAFSSEINKLANGRRDKFCLMTKDGFLELAMSFTGEASRLLRIRFVAAFNAMDQHLRSGLWQRRQDAVALFNNGADRASAGGRILRYWRDEKPKRLRAIQVLENQMQLSLPLN